MSQSRDPWGPVPDELYLDYHLRQHGGFSQDQIDNMSLEEKKVAYRALKLSELDMPWIVLPSTEKMSVESDSEDSPEECEEVGRSSRDGTLEATVGSLNKIPDVQPRTEGAYVDLFVSPTAKSNDTDKSNVPDPCFEEKDLKSQMQPDSEKMFVDSQNILPVSDSDLRDAQDHLPSLPDTFISMEKVPDIFVRTSGDLSDQVHEDRCVNLTKTSDLKSVYQKSSLCEKEEEMFSNIRCTIAKTLANVAIHHVMDLFKPMDEVEFRENDESECEEVGRSSHDGELERTVESLSNIPNDQPRSEGAYGDVLPVSPTVELSASDKPNDPDKPNASDKPNAPGSYSEVEELTSVDFDSDSARKEIEEEHDEMMTIQNQQVVHVSPSPDLVNMIADTVVNAAINLVAKLVKTKEEAVSSGDKSINNETVRRALKSETGIKDSCQDGTEKLDESENDSGQSSSKSFLDSVLCVNTPEKISKQCGEKNEKKDMSFTSSFCERVCQVYCEKHNLEFRPFRHETQEATTVTTQSDKLPDSKDVKLSLEEMELLRCQLNLEKAKRELQQKKDEVKIATLKYENAIQMYLNKRTARQEPHLNEDTAGKERDEIAQDVKEAANTLSQLKLDNILSCPSCEKVFIDRKKLKKHIESCFKKMGFVVNFICSVCCKAFDKNEELSQHYSSAHRKFTFVCSTCNHRFLTKGNLQMHSMTHKKK